jgi:DNA-binding Lrp family transcriptional regulator
VRFQGLTKEQEEKMMQEFMTSPYVNWIAKSVGNWDLMLAFYCRNVLEFAKRKEELLFKPYGKYIQHHTYSILENALIYTRDYLTNANIRDRPGLVYGGSITKEDIDESQREIIRNIRINGRYESANIARKLKLNVKTVISKIKDLEKRKIIQGQCVTIDQEKLGVKYFKIHISFQDHTEKQYKKVLEYCKNNKYVVNLMTCVADWEIELEVEAETVEEIHQLTKDLRRKYPAIIRKVDLHIITKEMKADYLPAWF